MSLLENFRHLEPLKILKMWRELCSKIVMPALDTWKESSTSFASSFVKLRPCWTSPYKAEFSSKTVSLICLFAHTWLCECWFYIHGAYHNKCKQVNNHWTKRQKTQNQIKKSRSKINNFDLSHYVFVPDDQTFKKEYFSAVWSVCMRKLFKTVRIIEQFMHFCTIIMNNHIEVNCKNATHQLSTTIITRFGLVWLFLFLKSKLPLRGSYFAVDQIQPVGISSNRWICSC